MAVRAGEVSTAHRIERLVADYYGATLDTITVGPEVRRDSCPPDDMYVSSYQIAGVPLTFPFRISTTATSVISGVAGGAEGTRALTHEDIGGVERFRLLAQQYHRDFPNQKSMSYWLTTDNDVSTREPYRSVLKGHPGLSVVVYEFDDYWGDGISRQLGIYWWNRLSGRWVLINRGALPDMR